MTTLTKPLRRTTPWRAPHGVRPVVVITLYPGGLIGLREQGRRLEVKLDAGTLYTRELLARERAARLLKQKTRKGVAK